MIELFPIPQRAHPRWVRPALLGLSLLGASLGALGGCERAVQETVRATLVDPVAAPVLAAPSDEQVGSFVQSALAAAAKNDTAGVNALVDWDALCRRGAAGLRIPESVLAEMQRGASDAALQRGVPALVTSGQGKLAYLGAEQRGKDTWQVLRWLPEGGGFEHIAFLLSKDATGKVRAVDLNMMTTGESSSELVRRMLLPMVATDSESVLNRLTGADVSLAKHAATIVEAQKAAAAERFQEALTILDKLPPDVKREKFVLIMRVNLSQRLDEATYLAAIDALAKQYPNDPATGVHQFDGYALHKRYDDAVKAIDVAEKNSVADAYFNVVRANILVMAERWEEAKQAAQRAVAMEPTLVDPHWVLVMVSLRQNAYAETTRLLLEMHQTFALSYALEGQPLYTGYVASPEYKKLKKQLSL